MKAQKSTILCGSAINAVCSNNNSFNDNAISNPLNKYSNSRFENRTSYQQNVTCHTSEGTQMSNPSRKEPPSQTYSACKEDGVNRSSADYTNIWHQQQYSPHNWTQASGNNNNRTYPSNISKYACTNRMPTFQNPRQLYMQFNPYLTQRAIIASQNHQIPHRTPDSNENQSNLRFGDYDYVQR